MILLVLPTVTDDEALLQGLQQGKADSVSATYERYFAPLYHYARLRLGDSQQAEDVVSEVFVSLIEVLGTRNAPRLHLRGWLFRVLRRQMAHHYQAVRPLSFHELEEWMPASSDHNPALMIDEMFAVQRVHYALRMLTPDHQEVLLLRFGQRLSLQETADIMGKSVSAIKSLQFRAVDTLRHILQSEADDHGR